MSIFCSYIYIFRRINEIVSTILCEKIYIFVFQNNVKFIPVCNLKHGKNVGTLCGTDTLSR